ncbi:MAG: hypothetical protein ACT4OQ_12565 [Chloroflexota bacterium]
MILAIERRLPGSLVLFIVGFAAIAVALAFLKGLQDPDYFWHLRTGELMLESGLPRNDPFSFTYGGAWVLHEWLSEVVIAWLDRAVGPTVSLAFFALLVPAAFVPATVSLRRLGTPSHAIMGAILICAAVTVPYATVRPQLLSWLAMGILISLLLALRPGRPGILIAIPILFVAWANFHGVYVLGLGVLGLYALATLLGDTPMASRRRIVMATFVAAFLAAALTPAGIEGLSYPLRYVDSGDWGLANIPEWQSPNFHDLVQLPLLVLLGAVALLPMPTGHRWLRFAAVLALIGALLANRNAPVAAVVSFPYVAMAITASAWRPGPTPAGGRLLQVGACVVIVAVALLTLPSTSGWRGVALSRYPATAIRHLAAEPVARLATEYGWGGFAIEQLYDRGTRVFVDGRNDMYPQEILEEYTTLREARPGWERIVDQWEIEALLFPADAPIVRGIAQSMGWCEVLVTDREVLLQRDCAGS